MKNKKLHVRLFFQFHNFEISFIFSNKLFKFFLVNKILSISAIRIITTTYKFAIFSISFYKIVPTFRTFSIIKNYISKSKWWKISNIRTPSPRYSKFKWQYFLPKEYILKLLIKNSIRRFF